MPLSGFQSQTPGPPGLFITGTDTEVGKTTISCAVLAAMRRQNPDGRIGVFKPFASGCRKERGTLVADDAQALAHFADCRHPLDVVCPVRFKAPMSPAAAAQEVNQPIDWAEVHRAFAEVRHESDAIIIEGVGGVMVPLDPERPQLTVLDLAQAMRLPVLVVARSGLGTLNHTAMTTALLESRGLRIAGIVMNGYEPDDAVAMSDDPSRTSNRAWLEKLTGHRVVAVAPRADPDNVHPELGRIDLNILDSLARVNWWSALRPPAQLAIR